MNARFPLILAAVLLLPTLAAAGTAADSFHHQGTLDMQRAAYAASPTNVFRVPLEQGDALHAGLEWWAPMTDLDLILVPPTVVCPLADADCLAAALIPLDACRDHPEGSQRGFDPAEGWVYTAPVAGIYEVWVRGAFSTTRGPVHYALDLDIEGHADPAHITHARNGFVIGTDPCPA